MPARLLLASLLILAGCAGSPPDEPETIYGSWSGEGRQWNDGDRSHPPDTTWPVEIEVREGPGGEPQATITYPSFPCSGVLEYEGPSTQPDALPGDAIFTERIADGESVCYSGGTVLLRATGRFLLYAWAIGSEPTEASARLTRK